jgi:hypothetical protein
VWSYLTKVMCLLACARRGVAGVPSAGLEYNVTRTLLGIELISVTV